MNGRARAALGLGAVLLLALVVAPPPGRAQPAHRTPRLGFLSSSSSNPESQRLLAAFRRGLGDLGYVEGSSIAIDYRWADLKYERLPRLAAELVERKVDVILAANAPAVEAVRRATSEIPIVTTVLVDPAAAGLVASLSRPGGNVTGLSLVAPEVIGKQLELLRQMVPALGRVAVLGNSANPGTGPQLRAVESAAAAMSVRIQPIDARAPEDLDRAFASMTTGRADGLIVVVDAMLATERSRIARLAARHRLPALYGLTSHVTAGGLASYGADLADLYRRAAVYVDKILKGTKPGDLPVEQPTTFELAINTDAARALGLTVPPALMLRADHVVGR